MNEPNERDILARLESTTNWANQGIVERDGETLLSLDEACNQLVDSYEGHVRATGLIDASVDEFMRDFSRVVTLLRQNYHETPELSPGTLVQTRGEGLCVVFDDAEQQNTLVGITDETRIRGAIAGLHVYPVLTDYALITRQYDSRDSYEPRLCMVLEQSNIGTFEGMQTEAGVVAIPLRSGAGVRLDRVV